MNNKVSQPFRKGLSCDGSRPRGGLGKALYHCHQLVRRVEFRGLPADRYQLRAASYGRKAVSQSVTIETDNDEKAQIILVDGTR